MRKECKICSLQCIIPHMKNLLLTTLLFLSFANAETFQCKVIGVTDGDTITCLTDQKEHVKVRLYQIDAPKSSQAYGQKAKQALSDMIYGKTVEVENMGKGADRYKRTFGIIFLEKPMECKVGEKPPYTYEVNVNLEIIKQGYAWYYPYDGENPAYQQAEQEAKAAKRGLWADKHAMPPWEWRKGKNMRTLKIKICPNPPHKIDPACEDVISYGQTKSARRLC